MYIYIYINIHVYTYIHTCIIYIYTCIYILNDPMISRHRFFQVAFFSRVCFFQQSGPKNPMVFPWFSAKAPWPPRTCTDLLRHHWPCLPAPGPAPVTWSHGGHDGPTTWAIWAIWGWFIEPIRIVILGVTSFWCWEIWLWKIWGKHLKSVDAQPIFRRKTFGCQSASPQMERTPNKWFLDVTRQAICGIKSLEVGVCAQKALRWKGNPTEIQFTSAILVFQSTGEAVTGLFLVKSLALEIFRYGSQGSPTKMDGFRPKNHQFWWIQSPVHRKSPCARRGSNSWPHPGGQRSTTKLSLSKWP